ncbi:enoyl-CoA hydratase [Erythrobacter sp. JK5]|nr:enoyl-CoA hydratase [Erythrobacter sp. JK5]QUL38222.1 enoyl-CoA hydratase [Erythrobacter sp. JK5]
MTATTVSTRLAAAAFSVILSAAFFAYAIVPATPTLVA